MIKWDERSRDVFRNNPSYVNIFHKDVKSGFYDKVLPYAEKKKIEDYSRNSEFEYYIRGVRAYIEHLSGNESILDTNITWYVSQINERKLKLARAKQGTKEYSEIESELEHLNYELWPFKSAKEMANDRKVDAANVRLAQERQYQQLQLDQQRKVIQAQQAQAYALQNQADAIQNQTLQQQNQNNFNNTMQMINNMSQPSTIVQPSFAPSKPVNCVNIGNFTQCR